MHLKIKDKNQLINYLYSESLMGFNKGTCQLKKANEKISATLYCDKQQISCQELLGLKDQLLKSDIKLINIYSSSRESIITAKSLKINGIFTDKDLDKL